jgi:hypothetical protein
LFIVSESLEKTFDYNSGGLTDRPGAENLDQNPHDVGRIDPNGWRLVLPCLR